MGTAFNQRIFISTLDRYIGREVLLRGWVYRLRVLAKTTFMILRDCSGAVQCVAASEELKALQLKLEDAVEIYGRVRADGRAKSGYEVDILEAKVLSRAGSPLPFQASSNLASVGQEVLLEYRPLAVRNEVVGNIFRIHAE